jgi:glycosyltransferase involved in cell wall biosynthesis
MKVLFIQKVKALAGSEKYFLALVPALIERGIQVEFLCVYNAFDQEMAKPFIAEYRKLNLPIHVLQTKSDKSIFRVLHFIKKVVNNGNFDLLHSHLIHADLWCALLRKTKQIKTTVVSTKHGFDEHYIANHGFDASFLKKNRYLRICKFAEREISASFAVSDGLKKLFIDSGIVVDKNRIRRIHHGFDLPELAENNEQNHRYAPQQIIVLGRIIPFKGHRYLFEAMPKIKYQFPDVKLVIIGHGDEDLIAELKEYAVDFGFSENILFQGYQANIYDYLQQSDLMVVPSIAEGFGLIFLEAYNAKIPLIGFDVPATNEVIVHEKTGVLVPLYNTEKLAKEINTILASKTKAKEYSEAGYLRLKNYFSLSRMVTETIQFYGDALALPESQHR